MLLNRVEKALMNNPVRASVQRHFEARRLLGLGGRVHGGRALELGCGRGVGTELILDRFGAGQVDAFDLDPDMVERAQRRLRWRGDRVRLWVGDAEAINAPDGTYDAVFDFGIIHHVPNWPRVIGEVARVLRPGGRFYAEEVLDRFILHPVWRRVLKHPLLDRFDTARFVEELRLHRFRVIGTRELMHSFAWVVADKPEA